MELRRSNENFKSITATHDKIAHFIVFMLESWLFVKIFAHRKVRLPISYNRSQLRGYNPLVEPIDIDLESNNDPIGNTNDETYADKFLLGLIICTLLVAVGSEIMQCILTHGARTFDILDILCNASGSSLGIFIAYVTETYFK
ncbi:similar to Saccharomyces cerevisiae YJR112W-A Putative protein of unknown function [Maudiozyma saulgeensis]|uniref:VanZ-like domain-containing protein n=1 Tax=Maudiozyma saulgeensis TaxID=1789683 RepID=A0A1X7R6I8_9SACH|nr:similar to Saccharomyces cerevisiae YJR112W-A Putative protein of unknown function [Kazachstania saulgeensis]